MGTLLTNESEIISRTSKSHLRTPLLYPPLTVGEDFFFDGISCDLFDKDLADDSVGICRFRYQKVLIRTPHLNPPLTVGEDSF